MVVMLYVRFPLSLRNVEDLLFERGINICHETVRLWWNRFGPMFAADIRRQRVSRMKGFRHWRWHLDEVYVKINGEMHYLWRAVDHEGEVLESYVTKTRDKGAALRFIRKALKRHGRAEAIVTDGLKEGERVIVSGAQRILAARIGEETGSPILVNLLLPFGAYLAAEHVEASGILAAVAAGITMSYVELSGRALATTRVRPWRSVCSASGEAPTTRSQASSASACCASMRT